MAPTNGGLLHNITWFLHYPVFGRTEGGLSPRQTVVWWEKRRPFYNIVMGVVGGITVCVLHLAARSGTSDLPGIMPPPGLKTVAAGLIVVNIGYTFGWIVEIVVSKLRGARAQSFGPKLFSAGVASSSLLLLLPAVVVVTVWLSYRLMAWLFGY